MIPSWLYQKSPYALKQSFKHVEAKLKPLPKRYGKEFVTFTELLEKSQWWSLEELESYQLKELERLVEHCYQHVPYYQKQWKKIGFTPDNLQKLSDLEQLPFLTKDDVRKNLDTLQAINIPKKAKNYVTTGGSTGIPLGLYVENQTEGIRMAFEWRHWHWAGYQYGDRLIKLRGSVIEKTMGGKRAWQEYDPRDNSLSLSTYAMTEELLPTYIQAIEDFRPKIIRGYPSALAILAKHLQDHPRPFNTDHYLKALSTTSESLYPGQRTLIEKFLKTPIFDKYGNCEQVTIIGQCEQHAEYHEFMEYGITELINSDEVVTTPGAEGELVGTNFTNYAMPFIRYRTEDLAVLAPQACACGRALRPFSRLSGRLQELVQTKAGNLISMTAINMHSPVFDQVHQFQFYQDTAGKVLMRIIKKPDYTNKDTQGIEDEMGKKFGPDIQLTLEFVEDIPLTARGKHTFLVQKLPIGNPT